MGSLSISTMWAIGRFTRAADFVAKAREIGFDQVELNHQVTEEMLQEYRALRAANAVRISSVHAPCPKWRAKTGAPMPEVSALDEATRALAVSLVKRTIDVAVEMGASAVIVHCGRVEMDFALERRLRELYNTGLARTMEFVAVRERLMTVRASRRQAHLEAAMKSLKEIVAYASERGVRLGLENRYHYYEIPLPDELRYILNNLDGATALYWHDLGHAHNLATLELVPDLEWWPALRAGLLGVHLHDAVGLRDHLVVGTGEINLAAVRPLVPASALLVCEFDRTASAVEVQSGYDYLKRLGFLGEGVH